MREQKVSPSCRISAILLGTTKVARGNYGSKIYSVWVLGSLSLMMEVSDKTCLLVDSRQSPF